MVRADIDRAARIIHEWADNARNARHVRLAAHLYRAAGHLYLAAALRSAHSTTVAEYVALEIECLDRASDCEDEMKEGDHDLP